jgi:hypothetical protein
VFVRRGHEARVRCRGDTSLGLPRSESGVDVFGVSERGQALCLPLRRRCLLQEAEEPLHVLGRRGNALCLPLRLSCLLQEAEDPLHGLVEPGILKQCN